MREGRLLFDRDDINNAVKVINEGGIILYPTDTIWGIGCDALNSDAVSRIYKIKERVDSKSMLILVNSANMLERYVDEIPEIAFDLVEVSEKPLTIIYDKARNLPSNLIGSDGSIGIRITNEEFSNNLITRFRKPIVSTSANISGMQSPSFFAEIDKRIIESVDYVVKFRQNERTKAMSSGIIKLSNSGEIKIIRE